MIEIIDVENHFQEATLFQAENPSRLLQVQLRAQPHEIVRSHRRRAKLHRTRPAFVQAGLVRRAGKERMVDERLQLDAFLRLKLKHLPQ